MELIRKEFNFPQRYDQSLMERQNKRESEILRRKNEDEGLYNNRPKLDNPFELEEEKLLKLANKEEVNEILNYISFSKIEENNKLLNKNFKCIICLNEYKIRDKIATLPCFHIFHKNCFEKWMIEKRWCPICKFNMSLESILSLYEK